MTKIFWTSVGSWAVEEVHLIFWQRVIKCNRGAVCYAFLVVWACCAEFFILLIFDSSSQLTAYNMK